MKTRILSVILALLVLLICFISCNKTPEICEHSESDWITDREPTLDAVGVRHTVCTICGETVNTETIPELYLSEGEVVDKLAASVVKVICYDYDGMTVMSQGSGFFIDGDGRFITNAHVVRGCFYIKVQDHLGNVYDTNAIYIYNDTASDYAICKAEVSSSVHVEFASEADVGDTVYALGYPADAEKLSTTSGTLSGTSVFSDGKYYYESTAWIDKGSSGGILANDKGKVIGITSGKLTSGKFAAIRYDDFEADLKTDTDGVSPIDYFHTYTAISLNESNISDYFEILVHTSASDDGRISYWLAVKLKNRYKDAKIILTSEIIRITVEINTVFATENTVTDTQYLTFNFSDRTEMSDGIQKYTSLSPDIEYGEAEVSYTVNLNTASGELIIYDI